MRWIGGRVVVPVRCLTMAKELKIFYWRSCLKQQGLAIMPSTSTGRRAGGGGQGRQTSRQAGKIHSSLVRRSNHLSYLLGPKSLPQSRLVFPSPMVCASRLVERDK